MYVTGKSDSYTALQEILLRSGVYSAHVSHQLSNDTRWSLTGINTGPITILFLCAVVEHVV